MRSVGLGSNGRRRQLAEGEKKNLIKCIARATAHAAAGWNQSINTHRAVSPVILRSPCTSLYRG